MPGRFVRSFYRNFVLLNPILSPLMETRHQCPLDAGSTTAWQHYLSALNAQFTLYTIFSVVLLSASAGFAFYQIGFRESTNWIVPLLARLAALQAFSAKILALVMGTHLRDLRRMEIGNVAVAWLERSVKGDRINILLQAPVAAMIHSFILLTIATMVFLILNPGMTLVASPVVSTDSSGLPLFPLWVRIVFSSLFFLEAIHCAAICHSFFKTGLPLRRYDEELATQASSESPPETP